MTAKSISRGVVPFIGIVAACIIGVALAVQFARREPPVNSEVVAAAPTIPKQPSRAQDQDPATLAAAQSETKALAAALAGSPAKPDSDDGVPSFDIVRIEPTGEAVVAGRAEPGATVDLLLNGKLHDQAVADQSGQFAMVPPRLPAGTYDLTLRSKRPEGKQVSSRQSVAVALEPGPKEGPLVALMTPDKPTVVLSQPATPKPILGAVAVEVVETGPGGKLHLSGRARSGAAMRLYLNDSFVSSVTAGADGRFAVTINEGVVSGSYRVRLDEIEPNSGTVRARAEVPFNVPDALVTASVPTQAKAPEQSAAVKLPQLASTSSTTSRAGGSPSAVIVPRIATTTVSRGDSLWRISRVTYGAGTRYAFIYKANREQIRNPNLIYPGQIFVVPTQ